jgi:hypothetical protein
MYLNDAIYNQVSDELKSLYRLHEILVDGASFPPWNLLSSRG